MADIFDQVAPQPQQSAPAQTGDVFDQVGQSTPTQQTAPSEQPGFLQRAWETSPGPGIVQAAKQSISDFVKGPDDAAQAFSDMIGSLSQGQFSDAAHHAAKLLTGSENPFQDAAKSVIKQYTDNALAKVKNAPNEIPGALAAKNYVADVKAGNTSGAIGDVVGGVASVAPLLLGDEASATKAKSAVNTAADAASDVAGKVKPFVSEDAAAAKAQPAAQSAVRGAAADTATAESVTPKTATSVRDAVQNTADSILERSKGTYQQLDDLSGGRWQRFSDSIKNLRDKADEVAGIDEDAYDKYTQRAADIEQAQSDLVDNLVKDGKIDADTAQSAVEDYRKAQSLNDLSQNIRAATKGRAGFDAEQVNVSSLRDRANKL